MNTFFLYVPLHGTLIACFLGLTFGILFFGNQLEHAGYASSYSSRWVAIFVLTFIVSLPNEYFISAPDSSIKRSIECINQTKNVRLREYMKQELDRENVREYKVNRVYQQCMSDKFENENIQKRKTQSQTLF